MKEGSTLKKKHFKYISLILFLRELFRFKRNLKILMTANVFFLHEASFSHFLKSHVFSSLDLHFVFLLSCRYLATTHFEPTYARSAFPCFDEPQFKATFKMIIIRNQQHKSLFNMPIKKIETVYYGYNMELVRANKLKQKPIAPHSSSYTIFTLPNKNYWLQNFSGFLY